jgi:proline racemase
MHTGGEPLRIITSGLPHIPGTNVLEKRRYFRDHYDHIRTGLMWEPRGHADMYGAVLTRSLDADFDVFFLHNEGYSTMCGHAIIALAKFVVETGLVKVAGPEIDVSFNVPAGRIAATALVLNGQVYESAFRNVPSFAYLLKQTIEVLGVGQVTFDIAFGGAFYAFVDAKSVGLTLTDHDYSRLIDYGRRIKEAVIKHCPITHPFEKDLSFLYGTIFTGPAVNTDNHSRNVCIFADGEVDRSATGSGVSARAALHRAKGELEVNDRITIESILGSTMCVQIESTTTFGPYEAVIPLVRGAAHFTGRNEFYFDPQDPFSRGFILR